MHSNTCNTTTLPTPTTGSQPTPRVIRPAVSTKENEHGTRLSLALPGVRKEDLKLTIHQSNIKIEATRNNNNPETSKLLRGDPSPVRYELTARLTDRLDGQNLTASLENGILTLNIPVREEIKPREIQIN
jgi:HSP20 family molecular chaperone IbpA